MITGLSCRDLKLRGALIFGKELKLLELEQLYNKVGFPRFLLAEQNWWAAAEAVQHPSTLREHGQVAG